MITARPEVRSLAKPIHGGRAALSGPAATAIHDFSTCVNAFGPPSVVVQAIAAANIDEYPDPSSRGVREATSRAWKVGFDEVAFGAGAAELIQALCIAFVRRGDDVLIATPAFGEYARSAALCGARVQTVSTGSGELISAIEHVRPRLVFLCTPGSPLGVQSSIENVLAVAHACDEVDALLVLDQSYDAFSSSPLGTPAVPLSLPVVHLRSLTKEFAIAGLRAAVAVGPSALIAAMETARVTWAASSVAQAAATACFAEDAVVHAKTTIDALHREADRLRNACESLELSGPTSSTHYFVLNVRSASAASNELFARNVLVRDCSSFGLPNCIRVAARTSEANDILIAALRSCAPLLLP